MLLELLSGTGSIGKAFRAQGWDVLSLDSDPRGNPTFCCDLTEWDYTCLDDVDAIWASPPCTFYSIAGRSVVTTPEQLEASNNLVRKVLEIHRHIGEEIPIFIENPFTGSLKHQGLLEHLSLRRVDYCSYGLPYRKRTAIWTNTAWTPARSLCDRHSCHACVDGKHTARAQRGEPGPCYGVRTLYRLPPSLCEEIADYCTASII